MRTLGRLQDEAVFRQHGERRRAAVSDSDRDTAADEPDELSNFAWSKGDAPNERMICQHSVSEEKPLQR